MIKPSNSIGNGVLDQNQYEHLKRKHNKCAELFFTTMIVKNRHKMIWKIGCKYSFAQNRPYCSHRGEIDGLNYWEIQLLKEILPKRAFPFGTRVSFSNLAPK